MTCGHGPDVPVDAVAHRLDEAGPLGVGLDGFWGGFEDVASIVNPVPWGLEGPAKFVESDK